MNLIATATSSCPCASDLAHCHGNSIATISKPRVYLPRAANSVTLVLGRGSGSGTVFARFCHLHKPVNLRKQAIYVVFLQFRRLEKKPQIEYNSLVVDALQVFFKSTRPPGSCCPEMGLCARSSGSTAWRNMSLRHVSLRETGWSRNPTSFGFARRNRDHRVRRRTDHSASTPSLLHRK
jgi:hypothetical protein